MEKWYDKKKKKKKDYREIFEDAKDFSENALKKLLNQNYGKDVKYNMI